VFIFGHPKSGTSLLTALLDSHPQLMGLPEESDFFSVIDPAIKALNLQKNISNDDKKILLSKRIFEQSRLRNFFRGKINEDIGGNFDYSNFDTVKFKHFVINDVAWNKIDSRELLLAIINAYSKIVYTDDEIHSFKYWIEKTPKHIYSFKKIKAQFPASKFIFILRDPRDNYVSYKKKHGNKITALSFSYDWNKCLKISETIPKRQIHFVKYEELIINSDKEIDRITNFLEINKCDALFQPTKMGIPWNGNSMFGGKKNAIDSSGLFRYKAHITRKDQHIIEVLCRSNMLKYQYLIDLEKSMMGIIKAYINNAIFKINFLLRAIYDKALNNIVLFKAYLRKMNLSKTAAALVQKKNIET
jgi:hypothetical protein